MIYGLLGKTLRHSYSKIIHEWMADYTYDLYETPEEGLRDLIFRPDAGGFNVTIPYKQTVIPFCDRLSPSAQAIGSVNTLYRDAEGRLVGDNTDYYGFSYMARRAGISFAGRKVVILGSGGTSLTARRVAADQGAREIVIVSRSGENHYENLSRHSDAEILINTTPVGMYPHNEGKLINLADFPRCVGVLDVIYNPHRTNLILDAEAAGIPASGGLPMLVAQAAPAVGHFSGKEIDEAMIEDVLSRLTRQMCNLVLVGMPGCGKSTVGELLAAETGRCFVDTDALIVERAGCSIPEIFARDGEAAFRDLEAQVVADTARESGLIVATGGGVLLREENRRALRQNSRVIFLERALSQLPSAGRPISQSRPIEEIYAERLPLYRAAADAIIANDGTPEETVRRILEV
ncbi:MAG: shikimate kinase [Ruminococcaceae bacterium]|nr:shikimate kinase [Oscillospiraceae bacterium]